MKLSHDATLYLAGAIAVIAVIATTFLAFDNRSQKAEIMSLQNDRNLFLNQNQQKDVELAIASSSIAKLKEELNDVKDDLEDLADDYRDERNRNEDFDDQLRDLAGTLGDLDKLAKTDEELLQKYSKVYFLNENYIPERLEQIDDKYVLEGKGDEYFHARAADKLEDLLDAARRADHDLQVVSAYRSFDEQNAIKGQFTQIYGEGANTFSADQGFSEHQLGTAVDFTTPEINDLVEAFANTEAYAWLLDNAHKYGFILSYPEDNTFYIFEPWHWRFVGEDLARDLERSNDTFYDLDQREIDEYLLTIFD